MTAIVPLQAFSDRAKENTLSVDASGTVRFCNTQSGCEDIVPTGDLKRAIDDGYEHISIVDIYKNGNQEVAATSAGECSRFFIFNRAIHVFSILRFVGNGRDICNYKINGNHLISSYKLDSKQYEDVYEFRNGAYQLVLSDGCVGCDQVTRSAYKNGRLYEKLLVTNQNNYTQRRPVTSSVRADRAWLYSEPSNTSRTKMYLVKGDRVQLLEFNDVDGFWYFVKYISKSDGALMKWVKCENISICK
ncbi:hypothetical protein [Paraburkholderia hiiakae]|nr:hypothetical protein [Paraburkholderia hiiakae]